MYMCLCERYTISYVSCFTVYRFIWFFNAIHVTLFAVLLIL